MIGVFKRNGGETVDLYTGLKGVASIPTDDLIPQLGALEIATH